METIPLENSTYLSIFLYGFNGAGKTYLAGTLPGKTAFIDYTGNPEVLRKLPDSGRFTIFKGPANWTEIQQIWTGTDLNDFDTIVLDNATGLMRTLVLSCLQIPLKGEGTRPASDIPIMRDYGLASERLRNFTMHFTARKTLQNIIMICHTKYDRDKEGSVIGGGASLPGQTPEFVLSRFSEVLYLYQRNDGVREVKFVQHTFFPAYSRVLSNTSSVANPNLGEIYKAHLRLPTQQRR